MSIINFVVIGYGHIGKRHAEMIQRNSNCNLVAIVDIKDSQELGAENIDLPFLTSPNL